MTLETYLMLVMVVALLYAGFMETWLIIRDPARSVINEIRQDFKRISVPLLRAGRGMVSSIGARLKRGAS